LATHTILQFSKKGTVTLPIEIHQKYGIDEGNAILLIGFGVDVRHILALKYR
jgi:bifunctional DNA-binding transcriptional regulator/antitoxin component of YhaV-PrlF toxin-antitoxin module